MPADRPTSGTGQRRQAGAEPKPQDDRGRTFDRALEREREPGAADAVHDRGRQPGAHGRQTPHHEVKPGARRALEEADTDRAEPGRRE